MSVLHSWQGSYWRACFIDSESPQNGRNSNAKPAALPTLRLALREYGQTRACSAAFDGPWRDDEFLVVPPEGRIESSNDRRVVTVG
jgi:hypothetical protein